jgi:type VI secretion system secreted protein Hcp
MAYQFYMSLKGSKQGTIKGGSKKPGRADWSDVLAIYCGVPLPWTLEHHPRGDKHKHKHSPFKVTKELDIASPLLFQACVTQEILNSVIFEVTETRQGIERGTHQVILTNAVIMQFVPRTGLTGLNKGHEFTFSFERVTVTPEAPLSTLSWVREWQGFASV